MLSPNELTRILQDLDDADRQGVRTALATVVLVSGSTYRRPGARLLVRDDGQVTGGVSGGCLEADVVRKALAAMQVGQPTLIHYDTTDDEDDHWGTSLGCRGESHILIEPVWLARTAFHIACLRERLTDRQPRVLALRFRGSGRDLGALASLPPSQTHETLTADRGGSLNAHVTRVLAQRRWRAVSEVEGEPPSILLEYLPPVPRLLIVGGGPDSEPLAACAHTAGYQVTVADERPGTLSRRRFPTGTRTTKAAIDYVARQEVDAYTACVVATHNVAYDMRALANLIPGTARYVGVLGPRKRTQHLLEQLRPTTSGDWERLYAPTGLDIGADTPEQIALAVLAEIQAVMAGRSGGFLRHRPTPIHDDVDRHVAVDHLHV